MEKQIKVSMVDELHGTGTDVFALIMVNQDDSEDTQLQLWRADNEEHLYDQVSEEFYEYLDEDPEDFHGPNFEEEIWGLLWIPKRIGKVE